MRRAVVATVAALMVAGGVGLWWSHRDPGPIGRAQRIVEASASWETGTKSGESLARIASILITAGRRCDRRADPRRCDAVLSAAAWAETSAFRVLRCSRPGVFQARQDARALLRRLDQHRLGQVPATPRC